MWLEGSDPALTNLRAHKGLSGQNSGHLFRHSLPDGVLKPLSDLVRATNCHYSNLIEGHDTHPVDIERALNSDLSAEPKTRNLQLEAKAHIAVQQWIDEDGGLHGREFSAEGIREIHRRFCEGLPVASATATHGAWSRL
jgi:Fic family protein